MLSSLALWPVNTYAEAYEDSLRYIQVTVFKTTFNQRNVPREYLISLVPNLAVFAYDSELDLIQIWLVSFNQ